MEKPVDMKLTKNDAGHREGAPVKDGPAYPWGLMLRLDKTSLEKLGMTKDLPEVGVLCQVIGTGRVISVSERETKTGKDCDVEIQIEKLNLALDDEEEAFERGFKKGSGRGRY